MNLNKVELRKISHLFHSMSNRLLQADFGDYTPTLQKFCRYIQETPLIYEYVISFGTVDYDVSEAVDAVANAYGSKIFALGDTEGDEVRNVYAILTNIADNKRLVHYGVGKGYTSSNQFQDRIRGFNDRVVMVLIRHVENYLVQLGIDMGLDDKVVYNVNVVNGNGQVSIAMDGSFVEAKNIVNVNTAANDVLNMLESIKALVTATPEITPEEKEQVADDLDIITEQIQSNEPKRSRVTAAVSRLKQFAGDLTQKVMVSVLASELVNFDWSNLWEKIELFLHSF